MTEFFSGVTKNDKYGYYELADEYRKTMDSFYSDEYFQGEHALYTLNDYDPIDLENKRNYYTQKLFILKNSTRVLHEIGGGANKRNMLDIGAGEGFALAFFKSAGWDVTGIDLSTYGVKHHNPSMLEYLIQGKYDDAIRSLNGRTFDFINADNLLEHVPEPEEFFKLVKTISHDKTILCVSVPNDFSIIQRLAFNTGAIDEPFWVTKKSSEHFSYFSVESLSVLAAGNGYTKILALGSWPIDFFLLNDRTNYRRDNSVGHDCHVACAELENALCRASMEKAVNLMSALAEAGLGRNISVYFRRT